MSNTTAVARVTLLTPKQVAEWIGVTVQALSDWRYRNEGPEFIRLGRMIRYDRATIEAFIDAGRVQTSA